MHAGANETKQFPGKSSFQQGPRLSFVAVPEGLKKRLLCARLTEIKNNAIITETSQVSFSGCSTGRQHAQFSLKPRYKCSQVFPKESYQMKIVKTAC